MLELRFQNYVFLACRYQVIPAKVGKGSHGAIQPENRKMFNAYLSGCGQDHPKNQWPANIARKGATSAECIGISDPDIWQNLTYPIAPFLPISSHIISSSIFVLVSFQGFSITYAEHWFGRWSWHWAVALRHTGRQRLNVIKASPQPLSWSFYALWWLHQKIVRPNAIDEVGSNIFHIETILSQPNLWCRGSRSHGCNALDVPPSLRLSLELPTLVCKRWPKIKAYHHIKLVTSSLSLSLFILACSNWKSTCLQEGSVK